MRFKKVRTFVVTSIAFTTLAASALAEPMTKEQGDAILTELRQIKQLLQRPPGRPGRG